MFDPSRMRFVAATARSRHASDSAECDTALIGLIAESMVSLRNERGGATRDQLLECGFTGDELDRLGSRAQHAAAMTWHGGDMVEAAA